MLEHNMEIFKALDLTILIFVSAFLIGLLGHEYDELGLHQPLILMSDEMLHFFDNLIWPIIILLIFDLVVKYRKTKDPKKFVKKYWIDITMLLLIPIFSSFKLFKIGLSIVKKLKAAKMGVKIIHKTKKISGK